MAKHEIVFEDLRGSPDLESASVDLAIDDAAKGITRGRALQVAGDERGEGDDGKPRKDAADDIESDGELEDLDERPAGRVAVEDDEGGGDDAGYSERVRKRIQRERRLNAQLKADVDYWKQQAEDASRTSADVSKQASDAAIAALDTQIGAIERDLTAAIEGGQTGEQVKLMSKLTDLKAEKVVAKTVASSTAQVARSGETGRVETTGRKSLTDKWLNDRSDWYGKRGFERQTRLANRIDKEVYADGYRPNDPGYFKELDRRLKAKAPELYDDIGSGDMDDDDSRDGQRRGGKPLVAPVRGGDGSGRPMSSTKVELGPMELENMRRFGLDPANPEDLREYARNKREADADERRRQGGRS